MALIHSIVPRERLVQKFDGPSRTKQSFKDECDINLIMKKFQRTGMLAHQAAYQGRYEDVAHGLDYHASMSMVLDAQVAFMTLPAKVRKRFDNDPGAFLEFVQDPLNKLEMVELGLAAAPPAQGGGASAPTPEPVAKAPEAPPVGS